MSLERGCNSEGLYLAQSLRKAAAFGSISDAFWFRIGVYKAFATLFSTITALLVFGFGRNICALAEGFRFGSLERGCNS